MGPGVLCGDVAAAGKEGGGVPNGRGELEHLGVEDDARIRTLSRGANDVSRMSRWGVECA
jgi:hypothetical protein